MIAFSGCTSKEDKALTAVCNASADIQKQVTTLRGLTPATFTSQQVDTSMRAIGDDVKTIQDNVPALNKSVKSQVQSANSQFRIQFVTIGLDLGKSLAAKDAAKQAKQALIDLAEAYDQAFASLKCPI